MLGGCSTIHNAGPDRGAMRMAAGLDLPEITSENCLIAHRTAATVQVVSVGQRKWNGKVKTGGFVVWVEGGAMVYKGR